MRKRLVIAGAALLALVLSTVAAFVTMQPAAAATGIHVSGTQILEGNGTPFVMRGVSHAHVWYPTQTSSFANISALGANTVRVVVSAGRWGTTSAAELTSLINQCKTNRMICVLEVHDTTGYGDDTAATTLDAAANYWISVKSALDGQENYVIVNIGNEPIGNNNASIWTSATTNAIVKLRNAGFDHAIMVDAPNWGQDWSGTMRANAAQVFAADPDRNTIFSVHMYGVYDTAAEVTSYINAFRSAGLPLVVGEFGFNHSDGNPDEATIMAHAQATGTGWIAWSWSGNGAGVEYLDMVTGFNPNQLTSWGQTVFTGANGIRATSRRATVYPPDGGWSSSRSSSSSSSRSSSSSSSSRSSSSSSSSSRSSSSSSRSSSSSSNNNTGACTATYTQVGQQWQGGFQGQVTVRNSGTANAAGWNLTIAFANGQSITQIWGARPASGAPNAYINESWNGNLAPNASATAGFIASWNGTNAAPTVSCTLR